MKRLSNVENFPPGPSPGQGLLGSSPSGSASCHLLLFHRSRWVPWAGPAPCRAPDGSATSRDCVCRRSVCHSPRRTTRAPQDSSYSCAQPGAWLASTGRAVTHRRTWLHPVTAVGPASVSRPVSHCFLYSQGCPGQTRPLTLWVTAVVSGPPANQSVSQGRAGQPTSSSPPITCVASSSVFRQPIEVSQRARSRQSAGRTLSHGQAQLYRQAGIHLSGPSRAAHGRQGGWTVTFQ